MHDLGSSVFPRNFAAPYEIIVSGSGSVLTTSEGKRYLDAVCGTSVASIGHGVAEIYEGLSEMAASVPYVYGATFTNPWQEKLAELLLSITPRNMAAAYFLGSGSEANETAIRMARQYHLLRGHSARHKVISRRQSYHGMTFATLSLSDRPSWRKPYDPYLLPGIQIASPYMYRKPVHLSDDEFALACADELEKAILSEGAETISAFIAEPVSGTSVPGNVPPLTYFQRIREICDRYGVLFIADEILCGFGRTGDAYAIDAFGVLPDILTTAKGLGSGYAPIAGTVASSAIVETFRHAGGEFTNGFTYSGHPLSCLIAARVFEYCRRNALFERSRRVGERLKAGLDKLAQAHASIGDVRGRGCLMGVEFVASRATREPFVPEFRFAARVVKGMRERGVIVMEGTPGVNFGRGGDQIQIAPPFVITEDEIGWLLDALDASLGETEAAAGR